MYHECGSTKHGTKTFKNIRLQVGYSNLKIRQQRKTPVRLSSMLHLARIERFSLAFDAKVGSRKL
jgi:hypothetical protein